MLKRTEHGKTEFIYLFSWFVGITTTIYFFCVSFGYVPHENRDYVLYILGFMTGTAFGSILAFHFGGNKKQSPPPNSTTLNAQITDVK